MRTTLSDLFVANLRALMASRADRRTQMQVANASRGAVSQRSVSRILNGQQEPTLGVVEGIAKAFGLQGWQMLVPDLKPGTRPVTAEQTRAEREAVATFLRAAQNLAQYELDRAARDDPE